MIVYLGRMLAAAQNAPVQVQYLARLDAQPAWIDGQLLAIDPQGACFARGQDDQVVVDCLPWGSIAGIRVVKAESTGAATPHKEESHARSRPTAR